MQSPALFAGVEAERAPDRSAALMSIRLWTTRRLCSRCTLRLSPIRLRLLLLLLGGHLWRWTLVLRLAHWAEAGAADCAACSCEALAVAGRW